MFLKNIKINNFRSIQKASVDFENGMNILIGKNGAGKSNLLNFISRNVQPIEEVIESKINGNTAMDFEYTLSDDLTNGRIELGIEVNRSRILDDEKIISFNKIKISKSQNNNIILENEFDSRNSLNENKSLYDLRKDLFNFESVPTSYITFEIAKANTWLTSSARYEISTNSVINSFQTEINEFSFLSNLDYKIELGLFNLIVFQEINNVDINEIKLKLYGIFKNRIDEIELIKFLKKVSPIVDIRIKSNINIFTADDNIFIENLHLEFNIKNSWVPWSYLSDGTKRLFYLISECLSLREDGILLIEEPELGIHPHQLFSLMNFLKEQSETKQIIISTHSPIVLDVLPPDELNRITIVKLGDKGTEFHKLNKEQIEKAQNYMSEVGELSYYWLHSDLEDEA